MLPIISIAAWLACAVIGYLVMRRHGFRAGETYTVGDRNMSIFIALLLAPVCVFVGLYVLLMRHWDDETPANW